MSKDQICRFWCLIDDERTPFSVNVGLRCNVGELAKAIRQERPRLYNIDITNIVLWKLNDPIPVEYDDADDTIILQLLRKPITNFSVKLGKRTQKLSDVFPNLPEDHLHVIISLCDPSERQLRPQELEKDHPWNVYIPRQATVSALYEKLMFRRWLHVRGTPGSGKSVLAKLLCNYIQEQEPDTKVVLINVWPENQKVQTSDNTILILDEAQTTYGDKDFWSRFKNPGLENMRVVAFARHAGPGNIMPLWIPKQVRVGLARLDTGDGIVLGLLFTRNELNALVQLRFRDRGFSDTFLDCVYDMTNGHVGACEDLMNMVIAHESYRHRVNSAEYTYEMFITGVSMNDIPQAIYSRTVFGRGLPQASVLRENPDVTAVLNEVIRKESIVCSDHYLASNPNDDDNRKAALRKIFRSGWLHTEMRADIDGILYTFASPLHRRCIDWQLNGSPLESRIIEPNLFEFALAIIQRLSRQGLEKRETGPKAQSIPEAQFQDEFYSASSKHANGSVSFPEFGMKNGRIDFFIRLKKWGVELLRDGNRLVQHARRFTEGEYGKWIEKGWMSDYIIIDFRTQRPRIAHRDVDKLIYVVSIDDWNTIEVLDNEGRVICQYSLLNNS